MAFGVSSFATNHNRGLLRRFIQTGIAVNRGAIRNSRQATDLMHKRALAWNDAGNFSNGADAVEAREGNDHAHRF